MRSHDDSPIGMFQLYSGYYKLGTTKLYQFFIAGFLVTAKSLRAATVSWYKSADQMMRSKLWTADCGAPSRCNLQDMYIYR
jgi:hypothetical protein